MSMFVVVAMHGAIRAVADGEAPAGGRRIGTSCKPFSAMPVRDNATPPQVYREARWPRWRRGVGRSGLWTLRPTADGPLSLTLPRCRVWYYTVIIKYRLGLSRPSGIVKVKAPLCVEKWEQIVGPLDWRGIGARYTVGLQTPSNPQRLLSAF